MKNNFKYVTIDLPDYLAQYFAHKVKSQILTDKNGIRTIHLTGKTEFGKKVYNARMKSYGPVQHFNPNRYYLQVSDFYNYNKKGKLNARIHNIMLDPEKEKKLISELKESFNDSLSSFVSGAEFAHTYNGWDPSQKRKGIRKLAIQLFLKIHKITCEDINFESICKVIQRKKNRLKLAK